MCTKVCVAFIFAFVGCVSAASRFETLKQCCSIGTGHANAGSPCTAFTTPIPGVEAIYEKICLNSMDVCCKNKFREKQCGLGQEDATAGRSCDGDADELRKQCCEACKLGFETKGSDSCDSGIGLGPPYDGTFTKCCMETTTFTKATTLLTTPRTTTKFEPEETVKKTTPYRTTLKSMCGISDTCAQICIPDGNAFLCDCRKGYTLMKDGVSCKPNRVTARPNRCKSNPCDQKCLDTGVSIECSCYDGYELATDNILCLDVDECELGIHTCARNETCINLDGDYECYDENKPLIDDLDEKFNSNCPEGYKFNAEFKLCDDIDECEIEIICPRPKNCVNTIGSYKCEGNDLPKCPPGFHFRDSTQSCEDVDECILGLDDCNRQSQKCLNTKGNFTCIDKASKINCPPGFKKDVDTEECVDINECDENVELCGENEKCVNEPGRYTCLPATGNISPPKSVGNIPSTTQTTTTSTEQTTIPIKTTQPIPTYKVTPATTSIDNDLNHYLATTSKPIPSYPTYNKPVEETRNRPSYPFAPSKPTRVNIVSCRKGFRSQNAQCVDINECLDHNACDSNQDCFNTQGSFFCNCKLGFTKDYVTGACADVNECQVGTHDCLDGQRCDNTIGSFLCSRTAGCGTGYTLNYGTGLCEDDDECVLNSHNCNDLGPEFRCRNTLGSYRCERIKKQNSQTPQVFPVPKTEVTHNYPIINGQLKKCLPGYIMNARGDCEDIDECQSSPCGRGQKCLNLKGKFQCISSIQCRRGLELNDLGNGCVDVDECARGTHTCKSSQICKNGHGFYICQCPPGHKMNARDECEDVDECHLSKGRLCYINADCTNTIGSYTCQCKEGFHKLGQNCEDVDECKDNSRLCEQTCVNLWGSYRCSCTRGYTLNADNRTCSDIDECEKFKDKDLCVGTCQNVPGSYTCQCPVGYRLGADGRTCQDIDECQLTGCSDPEDLCINIRGSYKCHKIICPPNYIKEAKSRCKRVANVCDQRDTTCNQMPEHYSFFFITFISNLPVVNPIDFFLLRTPQQVAANAVYTLHVMDRRCPRYVRCATESHFKLIHDQFGASLSIVRSIEGPQDIELQLEMKLSLFGVLHRVTVTKIFMYVSEYGF